MLICHYTSTILTKWFIFFLNNRWQGGKKKHWNNQIYWQRLMQAEVHQPINHEYHQADTWLLGTALHRCTQAHKRTNPSRQSHHHKIRYSFFSFTPNPHQEQSPTVLPRFHFSLSGASKLALGCQWEWCWEPTFPLSQLHLCKGFYLESEQ